MAGTTTRQRYLDAVVEAMVREGRTDLTLVVLAEEAGTSDRMLIYYFKTREALLTEAMDNIRVRRRKQLGAALGRITRTDPADGVRQILQWLCSDENAAATRLWYDAAGRGVNGEEPFPAFLGGVIRDTVEEAEVAARRLGAADLDAQTFGTMFSALSTSLACDCHATGDRERVERAIEQSAGDLAALLATPA